MTNPDDPIDPDLPPFPEEDADADAPRGADEALPMEPDEAPDAAVPDEPAPAPAVAVTGRVPPAAPTRPDLLDSQEPLFRSCRGYRLRLEPPDLARLRELPGARGKSDEELGESFFDGQAERLAESVAGDVPSGAELRVVVDPYSRQAFVALEKEIRGILSF
jgi:hypothetical protein